MILVLDCVSKLFSPMLARIQRSPVTTRAVPDPTDIASAAAKLLGADKPMIWAGAGVLAAGGSAALQDLAELLGAPVFTTMPGKSALDESHPLALGAGCGTTTLGAYRWLNDSDVMLILGSSLTRTPYGQHLQGRRKNKFKIHNTVCAEDVNKEEYADLALVGDARLTALALIEAIKTQIAADGGSARAVESKRTAAMASVAELKAAWMKEWQPVLESEEEPIAYYRASAVHALERLPPHIVSCVCHVNTDVPAAVTGVIHALNMHLDLERSIMTHDAGAPR